LDALFPYDAGLCRPACDPQNNPLQVRVEAGMARIHTCCDQQTTATCDVASRQRLLLFFSGDNMKRIFIAAAFASIGIGASGLANAVDVGVGINIGVPPPVVVAPAPVVVVSPGWYGDRYWDGRRYWDRDEWEEHHHHHGHEDYHCPPGHAKKGEC
jgi:hypothetical protein